MLKKKLHEHIDAMDDEFALQTLFEDVMEYNKPEALSPWQLERLKESFKQCDKDKTTPHEEVIEMMRQLLLRPKLY